MGVVKLKYFTNNLRNIYFIEHWFIDIKLHIIQTNLRSNSNGISMINNIESSCHEIQVNTIFSL